MNSRNSLLTLHVLGWRKLHRRTPNLTIKHTVEDAACRWWYLELLMLKLFIFELSKHRQRVPIAILRLLVVWQGQQTTTKNNKERRRTTWRIGVYDKWMVEPYHDFLDRIFQNFHCSTKRNFPAFAGHRSKYRRRRKESDRRAGPAR